MTNPGDWKPRSREELAAALAEIARDPAAAQRYIDNEIERETKRRLSLRGSWPELWPHLKVILVHLAILGAIVFGALYVSTHTLAAIAVGLLAVIIFRLDERDERHEGIDARLRGAKPHKGKP